MIGQKALVQRRARQLVTPETSDSENGSPESKGRSGAGTRNSGIALVGPAP